MSYTIKNLSDKYFITNTGNTEISYVVKKSSNCVNYNTIYDGTLPLQDDVAEITFIGDGEYLVEVTDNGETVTHIIKYYLQLQTMLIDDVKAVLCGCSDCDDDVYGDCECDLYISTKNKMDVFRRLVSPQAEAFFNIINQEVKCIVEKEIYCDIGNEIYSGNLKFNDKLFKILLSLDYLALYFFELDSYCLQDELCYVKTKYKTEQIFCCIEKLGINITKLETLIDETMGTLTITSAAYINQPPSQVGDNTINVANRASTVLTLAMFTTNTTPAYSDPEGDPADAVRIDTLPPDGELLLNGVPVTAGQIIDVADINANLLVFNSPNQDPLDSDAIQFSVRDSGSGQFTS